MWVSCGKHFTITAIKNVMGCIGEDPFTFQKTTGENEDKISSALEMIWVGRAEQPIFSVKFGILHARMLLLDHTASNDV